jgi:hypothetical protein
MIDKNTPPGTKIVCIKASAPVNGIKEENIYTVAKIEYDSLLEDYVVFVENHRSFCGYWLWRFRLLQVEPDEFGEVEDDD